MAQVWWNRQHQSDSW